MKMIRIYDYTGYDPARCNNGGSYGFWTKFTELNNGDFEVSYGTTSDFDFCPCCGNFGSCDCTEFGQITKEEMDKILSSFEETNDEWIEEKEI